MDFKFVSINGQIRPAEEAVVPLTNIEYGYGFGVYESLRVVNGKAYFLTDHIERLLGSAKIIGLTHAYTANQIAEFTETLIKKLNTQESYNLKILLIGGKEPLLYILPLAPLFVDKKLYRDGASVITARYERPFPQAKTLSMLGSYLGFKKAKEAGCYDALAVDRDGVLTEGTRTNLFFIKDKTIFTAPKEKILEGVTKKILLGLAQKNGFTVVEKSVRPAALAQYDGAFLTATSAKVLPIKKIDDYVFKNIPESIIMLEKLYDEHLEKIG